MGNSTVDMFSDAFARALNSPNGEGTTNKRQSAAKGIGIVMGSDSDWPIMQESAQILKEFGVPFECRVISAHRTPDLATEYAKTASGRGVAAIIAGAGGAAHLAGVLAAQTTIPVLGVPIPTQALHGLDSLYSIVQMPKGIPVATFAIGAGGAANAALFAIAMLALNDARLAKALADFRQLQAQKVSAQKLPAV